MSAIAYGIVASCPQFDQKFNLTCANMLHIIQ